MLCCYLKTLAHSTIIIQSLCLEVLGKRKLPPKTYFLKKKIIITINHDWRDILKDNDTVYYKGRWHPLVQGHGLSCFSKNAVL